MAVRSAHLASAEDATAAHDLRDSVGRTGGVLLISDAVPWKDALLRIAGSLEGRTQQRRWTERTSYPVERDVMNAAYAMRKLNEARRITDELAAKTVSVRSLSLIRKPVDVMNRHDLPEYYDLQHPKTVGLSLNDFCNQIIHSWVWVLSSAEEPPYLFDGVYVSSDRARKRHVYFVAADTLIKLIRAVGNDDVDYVHNGGTARESGRSSEWAAEARRVILVKSLAPPPDQTATSMPPPTTANRSNLASSGSAQRLTRHRLGSGR